MQTSLLCALFPNRSGSALSPFTTTVNYAREIVYLEHIVVKMTFEVANLPEGGRRGDVKIVLTSPSGTNSTLLGYRSLDNGGAGYYYWPFMSVMFWGENPAGEWTVSVIPLNNTVTRVNASVYSFEFYGASEIPQAVQNIPDACHEDCVRGCANNGSENCDACVNLRDAYTLECIDGCPLGYTERNGYCYNASLPEKTCNTALKEKVQGKKTLRVTTIDNYEYLILRFSL